MDAEKRQKIDTTLEVCAKAEEAINRVAKLLNEKIPMKLRYSVSKLQKKIEEEATEYRKQNSALWKEFGIERPTGDGMDTTMMIPVGRRDAFFEKIKELNETPVSIDWSPLDLTQLEAVGVTTDDITKLGPFVKAPADWE